MSDNAEPQHLERERAARLAAERSAQRLGRLQRLAALLAATRVPEDVARVVVAEAMASLRAAAALCYSVREDGCLELLGSDGPARQAFVELGSIPCSAQAPMARAFTEQRAEWLESPAEIASRYPQFYEQVCRRGESLGALVVVPLLLDPRNLGVVLLAFDQPRALDPEERMVLLALATQAAQALDRASLLVEERRSRGRLEQLNDFAAALSRALSREEVAAIIVEHGMRSARADACTLYTYDRDTDSLRLVADRGVSAAVLERIRTIDASSDGFVFETFRRGEIVWAETEREYFERHPTLASARTDGARARAFFSGPLVAEGTPIGLLGMGFHEDRKFSRAERAFVELFLNHCAEALRRSELLDAERAARATAERLQSSLSTTLRSIGDAVISTDAEGRVVFMNHVAEELTGWTEREARMRPLSEVFCIVNEQSRLPVESPVEKVLREGVVVGLANHTVLLGRNGEVPIDDSGAPIRSERGSIDGVVLVFRDIREKKKEEARRTLLVRASEVLAESLDYEATLQRVAELAVPALADWAAVEVVLADDSATTKQIAVAHSDPAKIEMARRLSTRFPTDPSSPTGVPNVLRTGRPELYVEIPTELIERAAVDPEHLALLRELKLRSGMVVPLIARGRVLGALTCIYAESGRRYAAEDLAFVEDLARRCAVAIDNARLYASERRAREAADVANRAKDQFLATVSHELRTPLNAILGWARMLGSVLDGAKRQRAVDVITRNAVTMSQLVEDLLDVSRIVGGKMLLQVESVQLARVVEAAIESVRPAADAKDIRIATNLDPQVGPFNGDPVRLQQVVWNLLSNAVKFTPRGGRVDVSLDSAGDWIQLRVSDNGRGIDRHFLPHVFEPFRQEEATYTRSRGGLGLGLSITRHLVELHGGRIEVVSEGEGCGSTFVISFPLGGGPAPSQRKDDRRTAAAQSARDSLDPSERLEGIRVLAVDDDDDARQLIKTVLEQFGSRVVTASDVDSAVAALTRDPPDILVSDISMPGKDGYDLIRLVRALPESEGGAVPAAALTAFARPEDRARALQAGYSLHIPKPVDPVELVAVIASLTRFIAPRRADGR